MDALCTSLSLNKWISSSFHCFGFSLPQECFHRAHSLNVASRFPWCLSFFGPDVLNGCVTQRKWPYKCSWSRQSVYKRYLSKKKKTSEVQDHRLVTHKNVCMCLYMCLCARPIVSVGDTRQVGAPGVPWQEPLKFISMRPTCQSCWQVAPIQPRS